MDIEKKGHTVILSYQVNDNQGFTDTLMSSHNDFLEHNLIINLTPANQVEMDDIMALIPISDNHRKRKKSFVVVVPNIDFNEVPDEIMVVPTILEAHDLIEMEEIERDLGF
ncbi:ribonuclease Z [Flavobacterium sp. NST-5]|uniref:Ribonuclease Z n=1 Tax=Flavobacterium ichthyis TaxID=2698827 RepID=A0ABW9Z8V6_9FLAO|nr:ribonuclease Z [Flavobacterium ichthyis]NBL65109.1 ribonuclease Z [Flavobacterium ichthyis]